VVEAAIVLGGGHVSFLSPLSTPAISPGFAPSQHPGNFDRAAYGVTLDAEIVAFLRRTIG
jgi:hypothetical protein